MVEAGENLPEEERENEKRLKQVEIEIANELLKSDATIDLVMLQIQSLTANNNTTACDYEYEYDDEIEQSISDVSNGIAAIELKATDKPNEGATAASVPPTIRPLRNNKPRVGYVYKTSESQRRAVDNWRRRNLTIARENSRNYYYNNKERVLKRMHDRYYRLRSDK